jgi:hypothetical protein
MGRTASGEEDARSGELTTTRRRKDRVIQGASHLLGRPTGICGSAFNGGRLDPCFSGVKAPRQMIAATSSAGTPASSAALMRSRKALGA